MESSVATGKCHCGKALHYTDPVIERMVTALVDQLGEYAPVTVADVRLRQKPGRCRPKRLPAGPMRYRDEKPAFMTSEEALRGIEEGRYL